jgi:hypothetical protein
MDVAAWQLEEAGQRDRPAAQWVGHDPAVLANALKRLRSQMGDPSRAMRMHERYVPPGERRRLKSARALTSAVLVRRRAGARRGVRLDSQRGRSRRERETAD